MEIISSANSHLKWARRVRDSRENGLIFLEGTRLIEECLNSNLKLHSAFHLTDKKHPQADILRELKARKCPVHEIAPAAFASISDTASSQGLILIASQPARTLEGVLESSTNEELLVVALDQVQDPGNAGTIIRTAEAAGADAVLAMSGTTNPFSAKALRASMGSALRFPVILGTNSDQLVELARKTRAVLVAADANANMIYTDHDWTHSTVLIVGNEGSGLNPELLGRCDRTLRIPIARSVESLNVATAAAVMLFEAARQKSQKVARRNQSRGAR